MFNLLFFSFAATVMLNLGKDDFPTQHTGLFIIANLKVECSLVSF